MRTFGWASGFVVLAASLAAAQPPAGAGPSTGSGQAGGGQRVGQPPPPMTNLQIIPKATPRPQDLEKAVELDPNNTQANAQLQQLKGQ